MHQNNKFLFRHSADAPPVRSTKSRFRAWWSVALATVLVAQSLFAASSASASTFTWAATFGGGNNGEGKGIAVDSSGNVITTGHFQNSFDFDPGPGTTTAPIRGQRDIFISKLDSNGGFVWVKSLGGSVIDEARALELDSTGNIYITGDFRGTVDFDPSGNTPGSDLTSAGDYDMFITKRDSAGEFIWSKSFGSLNLDQGYDVAVGSDLKVYTTGQFSGTVNFDPTGATTTYEFASSSYDPYISALNSDGTVAWANFVKGPANERGQGVAVDSSNNVFLVGYFGGQNTDFNPTGTPSIPNYAGVRDIFLAKYNSNGVFQWVKTIGDTGNDYASGVDVDATGNIYVTGTFVGTVDFDPSAGILELTSASVANKDIFVAKFNNNGDLLWAKRAGGPGDDEGYHVEVNPSGNVVATGYFTGTVDFDPGAGTVNVTSAGDKDIFVWALDASGNYIDAAAMGGASEDIGYAVTTDTSGNVFTTGSFRGTADFDPTAGVDNKTSLGNTDIFVSKLNFFSTTPNTDPVANADVYTTTQNTALNGASVLDNDSDAEQLQSSWTASVVTNVSNGTLALNPNGTFVYTPTNGFAGVDTFDYMVSDGAGGTAQATATINVSNIPPVATDDPYSVDSGATLASNVLSNDIDVAGDTLSASLLTDVTNGTLTLNSDGSFSYISDSGFTGSDSFEYQVSDSNGGTDQGVVTITVNAAGSNTPPVASNHTYTVSVSNMLSGNLSAFVTDADGDTLTFTKVTDPTKGVLVLNSDGTFTYTPNSGASGQDGFEFQVSDGSATANATITINISATDVNNAPTAANDSATTAEDVAHNGASVLANDSDPDGDDLTVETTPVSGPANGTLQINADGTYVYTPTADFNGTDSFVYRVCDNGSPASECAEATVTITVTPVNDAPLAADDSFVFAQNSKDNVLNVLANDSIGPDTGETLSISAVGTPDKGGTAAIDGTTIKYSPATDFVGTETFTYTISDGNGGEATATATVTITVGGTGGDENQFFMPLVFR